MVCSDAESCPAPAGRCGFWYAPDASTTCRASTSPDDVVSRKPSPSFAPQTGDLHAFTHRRSEPFRVADQVRHDVIAGHEPVGVVAGVVAVRQLYRPVGSDQAEAVPAPPPGLADPAPLEDDVLHVGVRQLVAQRQPGVACADDGDLDCLGHGRESYASPRPPRSSRRPRRRIITRIASLYAPAMNSARDCFVERTTGLEPATLTLAT